MSEFVDSAVSSVQQFCAKTGNVTHSELAPPISAVGSMSFDVTVAISIFWGLTMKIINASNGRIINSKDVYIHDDVIDTFSFDRMNNKLSLSLLKYDCNSGSIASRYTIDFYHIIGFEMTACDFWGSSDRILDFVYIEPDNNTILPKLLDVINDNNSDSNLFPHYLIYDKEEYFETEIIFCSGDKLRTVCRDIIIDN